MSSLFLQFLIIVTVIVSIVDIVRFYAISTGAAILMIPFVVLVIVATIIPIAINLWNWLVLKGAAENRSC
jgi:tryptophan-rich sensory protein